MKITTKNDGKGKAQSWEAELVVNSESTYWGSYNLFLTGYGSDEFLAKENLKQQFNDLLEKWNENNKD